MSGNYTPLFDSLTTGSLCGKWPDVGIWPIILSIADRYGAVDVTVAYLAGITGLKAIEISQIMKRFCETDSDSRSSEEGGARLVLVDPENRGWGWRVVNHGKYRERARLAAKNAAERRKPPESPESPVTADERREPPLGASKTKQNKTKQNSKRPPPPQLVPPSFHEQVVNAYHDLLPNLPRIKQWTKTRRLALDARIDERCRDGRPADAIAYWREFFIKVAASDFLYGRSGKFAANLEWLLRPENFLKTIEGNYDNRCTGSGDRIHAG
jgi:hypothetical protein